MSSQIISIEKKGVSITPVIEGDICDVSAKHTATLAKRYASELSNEYHNILHRHLQRADPKIAARFSGLISELCLMTDVTLERLRFHQK